MSRYQVDQPILATVTGPLTEEPPHIAVNLVNNYGLRGDGSKAARHNNHRQGSGMWLLKNQKKSFELCFDLGDCLPLGDMLVWNYNRAPDAECDYTLCGVRMVELAVSLDGIHWDSWGNVEFKKADGQDEMSPSDIICFKGRTLRYLRLRIAAEPGRGNHDMDNLFAHSFGLSKVKFFVGEGFVVQRDQSWSNLLCNNSGWTGSDGVFTIPMNGSERFAPGVDTTITFGDTLIDTLDPVTLHRSSSLHMIHNSYCFLKNSEPIESNRIFGWGRDSHGGNDSLLKPTLAVQNDQSEEGYYWPQDSILVGQHCYTFPLTVLDWPEGPEGFRFKVDGVAMVVSPVEDGHICFDKAVHHKTNLYYDDRNGRSIMYGGCTLPDTAAGGAEAPEGYIYLYGTIHEGFGTELCVARIPEQQIEDGFCWQFFDGNSWVTDISKSAALASDVSCELSVSRLRGKLNNGQYILIYQDKVNTPFIAYRTAPTPWGPFSEGKKLFFTDEVLQGRGIYTYNAKGHPHLAPDGELLISYNVNTIAWEMHEEHGDICRPKFLRMYEVAK